MTDKNGKRIRGSNHHGCVPSIRKRVIITFSLATTLVWRMRTFSSVKLRPPRSAPVVEQTDTVLSSASAASSSSLLPDGSETKEMVKEEVVVVKEEVVVVKEEQTGSLETPSSSGTCAPRDGVVVLNTMGRLANNIFEVGFAKRMATELCWELLYRPWWQGEIPNPRAAECFPHAGLPADHGVLTLSPTLRDKLDLNETFWQSISHVRGNRLYLALLANLKEKGLAIETNNNKKYFTGDGPETLLKKIHNKSSNVSLLSLNAFFIHADWMRNGWADKVREWFTMNPACCHHQPPDDAVVIHVRDFRPRDETNMGFTTAVYTHILSHYNLTERPLWIVCQPKTADSKFVKELTAGKNATIVTGQDQYDAFCTLARSKTLLLTSASTFSQMAAFLASSATEVHYPFKKMFQPKVTLEVPGWKYHLVDKKSLDKVVQFEVPREKIRFKAA